MSDDCKACGLSTPKPHFEPEDCIKDLKARLKILEEEKQNWAIKARNLSEELHLERQKAKKRQVVELRDRSEIENVAGWSDIVLEDWDKLIKECPVDNIEIFREDGSSVKITARIKEPGSK